MHSTTLLGLSMPGGSEWIIIALFGLLLFGKRLPEIARAAGNSVTEFKKGLQGIDQEIDQAAAAANRPHQQSSAAPEFHHSPELLPPPEPIPRRQAAEAKEADVPPAGD